MSTREFIEILLGFILFGLLLLGTISMCSPHHVADYTPDKPGSWAWCAEKCYDLRTTGEYWECVDGCYNQEEYR